MQTLHRSAALLAMLLLFGTACAARSPEAVESERMAAPAEITVVNLTRERMTIYVDVPGERVRLGNVTPGSEETFRIPSRLVPGHIELRFLAEPAGPLARPAAVTHTVAPGDRVDMILR